MRVVVELYDAEGKPQGLISHAARDANTLPEPVKFIDENIARQAAQAAVWGDPNAFWESERKHAEKVRRERKGWTFKLYPAIENG